MLSLCSSNFYNKNHGVGDKWNDGIPIQNRQQAFRSFYKVSENVRKQDIKS